MQFLVSPGSRSTVLMLKKSKQKATPLFVVNVAIQQALAPGFPSPSAACASLTCLGAREPLAGRGRAM